MGARALIVLTAALATAAALGTVLTPPSSAPAAVVLGSMTVGFALFGLGRGLGALAGDADAPAALAIAWGLAAYLAVGGWLAAAGGFTIDAQRGLALAGVAGGVTWVVRRRAALADAARAWRPASGSVVTLAAAALIAVQVLGTAGARHDGFGDGHGGDLLGPLARLAQTGELAGGSGGAVVATSLGWALGDWRACHAVDGGLALALAVALAFGLRVRDAARSYVGFAIVALALGLPALSPTMTPRWTVAALALATVATLRRTADDTAASRRRWLAALVAAATATLTPGGLGLALVALVVVAVPGDPRATDRLRRVAAALALAVAVLGGYLVAQGVAAVAPARAAAGLIIGALTWALGTVATRGLDDRTLATSVTGLAAALAAALALAPSLVDAAAQAQPFVLAALVLVALSGLRSAAPPTLPPLAIVGPLAIAAILAGLRFPTGTPALTWGQRATAVIAAARELGAGAATDRHERAAYRAAFAVIPRGARVGVWTDRADLIDYRRHTIVDLRPRRARPTPAGLAYLVIAPSAPLPPDHPVRTLVAAGHAVASRSDLTVVELGSPMRR